MKKWLALGLGLFHLLPVVQTAHAGLSEAAVLFLVISNSPRANAMGISPITFVDPQSVPYNPGAMAILHLDRVAAVTFPSTEQWLPTLADDLYLKSYNFSAGASWRLLTGKGGRFNASLGLGYSRHELSLGTQTRVDEFGNILGEFETYEAADLYTGSVAIQYYAKIGVGYTHKKISSVLGYQGAGAEPGAASAEATAVDWGLYAELPLSQWWTRPSDVEGSERYAWTFELTPGMAYVNANSGDDISYIDAAQADPLPQLERIGASVYAAANVGYAVALSTRVVWQQDRSLVGSTEPATQGRGTEVGLLGMMYYRWGRYEDDEGQVHINTEGFGLRLSGLVKWVGLLSGREQGGGVIGYLRDHLDFTYDHAEYTEDDGGPVDGTDFACFTLSF